MMCVIYAPITIWKIKIMDQNKASGKLLYHIGVGILAGTINGFAKGFTLGYLASYMITDASDLNRYFIYAAIISIIYSVCIFIIIYNVFSTLNIHKVMPYIYGIRGVGMVMEIMAMMERYESYDTFPSFYLILPILAFAVSVFAIRAYYINNPDRWYW